MLFYSLRGTANKCGLGWASLVLLLVDGEKTKFRLQADLAIFLIRPMIRVLVGGLGGCIEEFLEAPLDILGHGSGRVVEGHSRSAV